MKLETRTFRIAALSQDATVHILFPDAWDSGKRFSTFYMNDGHGVLHDDLHTGDEGMRYAAYIRDMGRYLPELIVVAVEAPADRFARMRRYFPVWHNSSALDSVYGADFVCAGEDYARWLAEELKPWVDAHCPTLPEKQHTGVGGLSASCISAIYTGGRYRSIFSKVLLLSPSAYLWWDSLQKLYEGLDFSHIDGLYLYYGTNEQGRITQSDHFTRGGELLCDQLLRSGLPDQALRLTAHPGGEHTFVGWRPFFPEGLRWLYR